MSVYLVCLTPSLSRPALSNAIDYRGALRILLSELPRCWP
jgi:hypothetical protein